MRSQYLGFLTQESVALENLVGDRQWLWEQPGSVQWTTGAKEKVERIFCQ
jgi:hypothetical protein